VMMEEGQGGRIVHFTTSDWLTGADEDSQAYVAAKTGVVGLTRGLARAYGPYGILVNAVSVGQVSSPTPGNRVSSERHGNSGAASPLGRIGKPEEIANVVMFLCSRHASFLSGVTLNVTGGAVMY
jgi:NAD(P)-dependent dehydrogenase (short-subunit alcohol dehydrogenase family)